MQANTTKINATTRILLPLALACFTGATLVAPSIANAQDRAQERRDDARSDRRRARDEDHIRFTHSMDERRFDNGITLHRAVPVADRRLEAYFPHHYYSYPHYVVSRAVGRVVISPFSFYVGVFPPYIDRSAVIIAAPPRVFIDVPIYVHDDYRPYGDGGGDYYLGRRNDDNRWKSDPELRDSVYGLEDAFNNEDIALLAPLTDPNTNIAIFAKGRYEYTLNPNDYLDMTRDFLRSAHTTGFTAYRVHRRASGVYQVFARHNYQDQNGQSRTVYLCIVLERLNDRWTITQIDSSPAHLN